MHKDNPSLNLPIFSVQSRNSYLNGMNSGTSVQDPCKQYKAGGVRGLHCILLRHYGAALNVNPGLSNSLQVSDCANTKRSI